MAGVLPFRAYRYDPGLVNALSKVVTQPYDKISPALQADYYAASPYNICRVILGRQSAGDDADRNAYARAARSLGAWMKEGILTQDAEAALYPYFQAYATPDGRRLTRKAFIGAGVLEPFGRGVKAHERTLAGPKADRLNLLRALGASCELIFMLYDDPQGEVNRLLDEAIAGEPREATDEDGNAHRLWTLADPGRIRAIQARMAATSLLIADGHHRYETALTYQKEQQGKGVRCRGPETYDAVPMAFVALQDPGLTILPTHRAVHSVKGFDAARLLARLAGDFEVSELKTSGGAACAAATGRWTFALALQDGRGFRLKLKHPDPATVVPGRQSAEWKRCDVAVLHSLILEKHLGIGAKEMEQESNLHYFRSPGEAFDALRNGHAQGVFFVPPTPIEDVRRTSALGERMPQKSTDFYPKLLSGLVVYKIAF
jgi:uncharacterized protein (DUF1015 family)